MGGVKREEENVLLLGAFPAYREGIGGVGTGRGRGRGVQHQQRQREGVTQAMGQVSRVSATSAAVRGGSGGAALVLAVGRFAGSSSRSRLSWHFALVHIASALTVVPFVPLIHVTGPPLFFFFSSLYCHVFNTILLGGCK